MQVTEIKTNETLMEITSHGTDSFPLEYYLDEIEKFNTGNVIWHWHKEFEFAVVESGIVDCIIGNITVRLHEGDGIFINSGIIHSFESVEYGVLPNILFAPEFIAASNSDIYKLYLYPLLHSNISHMVLTKENLWQHEIIEQIKKICQIYLEDGPMMKLDVHALCCFMWSKLVIHKEDFVTMHTAGASTLVQSRLRKMLQFIAENHTTKLSLNEIVQAANISKSEALRCFKTMLHTSPIVYLNNYRLERAQELLINTDADISSIALNVGFESVSYFNRLYKKAFGTTPRTLRDH